MRQYRRWLRWTLWAALIALVLTAADERLLVQRYTLESDKVDAPVTFAVLTDYHGGGYGRDGAALVSAVAAEAPDAILLVGDMFSNDGDAADELRMFAALAEIAPAYYATGNHEFWEHDVPALLPQISQTGVTVLADQSTVLTVGDQRFNLCGIYDHSAINYLGAPKTITRVRSATAEIQHDAFTILLAHRPEFIHIYNRDKNVDLVLSGHAHGGQVRIPGLLNGLYAPNQGWLPDYAGGRFDVYDTTMIVSRGLSRHRLPPRIFNRPELVMITVQ